MRNTAAILVKELKSYFASPVAYVVTAVFLAIWGTFFSLILISSQEATMRPLFSNMDIILLFMGPILTMRLLAEEQSSGTIELLLTAPVRDVEVVLGKFLASFLLLLGMFAFTLYYPLLLVIYGTPDAGPIFSGYLGAVLLGASFLSVGLLTSSFTKNQIVAAVLAVGLLLLFWIADGASTYVGPSFAGLFEYIALSRHVPDLARGVIDTRDVVYFLTFIAVCLFLAMRSLESRRWR